MLEMTQLTANRIYDILVREAGASNRARDREEFVLHMSISTLCKEYRFQGSLGFGGKFWRQRDNWRISAYPEDVTLPRQEMIERANKALRNLWSSLYSEECV